MSELSEKERGERIKTVRNIREEAIAKILEAEKDLAHYKYIKESTEKELATLEQGD